MDKNFSIWITVARTIVIVLVITFVLAGSSRLYATVAATLELNGTGRLHVPNAAALNPTSGITIEAWVRRASANRCETVVGKNFNNGYWLGFCNGSIRFYTNGIDSLRDGNRAVPAGIWTHIAVTFDGTTRRYYLDGMLDFEANTPNLLPVNDAPLTIGADADNAYPFSGSIADVRLWRTARSQGDIRRNMVRLLDREHADLVATWHLEGGSTDVFGRYNASIIGEVAFTGPSAPPVAHDPILAPQLAQIPNVDGVCNPNGGEYTGLRLPIWYGDGWRPENLAWANIGATTTAIYVCMEHVPLSTSFAALYLDANDSGDATPQNGDYAILVQRNDTSRTSQGNGAGGYTPVTLPDGAYAARFFVGELDSTAEFTVSRSLLAAPEGIFRLQLMQYHSDSGLPPESGWPIDFNEGSPAVWPRFQVGPSTVFVPDSDNPTIETRHAPQPIIRRNDIVTIKAIATDLVDLASIEIFVDGSTPTQSCTLNNLNDMTGICDFVSALSLGRHTYYAIATDHRGRHTRSTSTSIFVQADGLAPQVVVDHTPSYPDSGQAITLNARATDVSGVRSITIRTDSPPFERHVCSFASANTSALCTLNIIPGSRRVIRYVADATDSEGLSAVSPHVLVLFGNQVTPSTPDSDGDGIIDTLEQVLGTSPTNVDSDHDSLKDGWEVLGLTFPGSSDPVVFSDFTNLPLLGANPRLKDVFVQYDYERGARVEPMVWPAVISAFRRAGVILHVTENERPWLSTPANLVHEITAMQQVDSGGYWFRPRLHWTHYYVWTRHNPNNGAYANWKYVVAGIATGDCPSSTPDPQTTCTGARNTADQIYALIHELGHTFGLGHGGRIGDNAQRTSGELVYYAGAWNDVNFKPNYYSVMNYRYNANVQCYSPSRSTPESIQFLNQGDFLPEALPNLIESSLNEQPLSPFAQALTARRCYESDYVPTMTYNCQQGDRTIVTVSDGQRTLAHQVYTRNNAGALIPGAWQYFATPIHAPGIDWNCDGMISNSVSGDINGDGAFSELTAPADYPVFIAGQPCTIPYDGNLRAYLHAPTYRDEIRGIDCRPFVEGGSVQAVQHTHADGSVHWHAAGGALAHPQLATSAFKQASSPVQAAQMLQLGPTNDIDQHPIWPDLSAQIAGVEACDGSDNDDDTVIDEGCNDSDHDQVSDQIDNCPQTANPDQTDQNGNYLGDACEHLSISNLVATQTQTSTIILQWSAPMSDTLGIAVYRQPLDGDGTAALISNGYVTVGETGITDILPGLGRYRYIVRVVNLLGVEGEEVAVEVGTTPNVIAKIYLPVINR